MYQSETFPMERLESMDVKDVLDLINGLMKARDQEKNWHEFFANRSTALGDALIPLLHAFDKMEIPDMHQEGFHPMALHFQDMNHQQDAMIAIEKAKQTIEQVYRPTV